MEELIVQNKQGIDVITSKKVAEVFEKRHTDVLRDIRNLHCSLDFRSANFALLVEMRPLPQGGASKAEYYEITRDGFTFLAMGYSGKKASEYKEKLINEFNRLEVLLKSDDYILAQSKIILDNLTIKIRDINP